MRNTLAFVVISAVAFGQLHLAEQRVADLTELIARKPDFAAAYYARGVTRLSMRQYLEAEQDLSKTIEIRPEVPATGTSPSRGKRPDTSRPVRERRQGSSWRRPETAN